MTVLHVLADGATRTDAAGSWQQVRDPADRRRVVYWRFAPAGQDGWAGAIRRHGGQWWASGYPCGRPWPWPSLALSGHGLAVDLGGYPKRADAETAVLAYAARMIRRKDPHPEARP